MAMMHYEGNFNAENRQLENINEIISTELSRMESTVSEMSSYWHDEKSSQFIADVSELIRRIKEKQQVAVNDGHELLNKVEDSLKIYLN